MPADPSTPVDPFLAHVRPPGWVNPTPSGRYNLVAIGAGAAGLVAAMGAAGLGGRVALIERVALGGDCLHTGCVPSKALLRAAKAAHEARNAARFGVHVDGVRVDFAEVMAGVRAARLALAPHDSARRFAEAGVDVYFGAARFVGPDAVEVGGQTLRFARALIATGSRPLRPDLPGLDDAAPFTSETIFDLEALPCRLIVLGAGPVGTELAQAFARLGSSVTLVERAPRVLPRDDPDASAILAARLAEEGVTLALQAEALRFEAQGDQKTVVLRQEGEERRVSGDAVLLALGREPVVEGLALEAAGVQVEGGRLVLDAQLRTTNPRIYAAGDAAGRWNFTHAADATARLVLRNALFFGRARADDLVIPWTTWTDPEVAHVGAPPDAPGRVFTAPLGDRSTLDGQGEGFVRLRVGPGGRLLGATIVAPQAGDLVAPISLALAQGLGVGALADVVLPYPSHADALRAAAGQWQRARLTPRVAWLFERLLAWRR
ncbi:MAG: FAD-dependent oxidoreductase [Alphaproteobacteria bacterium]|nr:FAD-dependent oxidoreductase [Alphaproteobacteria bacterium]